MEGAMSAFHKCVGTFSHDRLLQKRAVNTKGAELNTDHVSRALGKPIQYQLQTGPLERLLLQKPGRR
ncbi:hypothetical protein LSTR_LSTR011194 [Laodelphax striatellus]|uniref:Uncharacterized protein n=1 Tax=Laodelphax striatellus TaxID=195883 RepID=A0A482X3W3_LAOST|nr:hypothetical protein LSTR_LSTR011193 [Laodelphax striatellus]RZF40424.1 hypothetical protein LSTR_LSTR011194 [Laodelphax striatellus]